MANTSNQTPEENLRKNNIHQNTNSSWMPNSDENMLFNPIYLKHKHHKQHLLLNSNKTHFKRLLPVYCPVGDSTNRWRKQLKRLQLPSRTPASRSSLSILEVETRASTPIHPPAKPGNKEKNNEACFVSVLSVWWNKNHQRIQGGEDEGGCAGGEACVAESIELFVQRHHCKH